METVIERKRERESDSGRNREMELVPDCLSLIDYALSVSPTVLVRKVENSFINSLSVHQQAWLRGHLSSPLLSDPAALTLTHTLHSLVSLPG